MEKSTVLMQIYIDNDFIETQEFVNLQALGVQSPCSVCNGYISRYKAKYM